METEKCVVCNGLGRQQIFDEEKNKWTYTENSPKCQYCEGKGIRQYYNIVDGNNWLKKKIYI